MNVVVTGASGLLGRAVVQEFSRTGHSVTGIVYSRVPKQDESDADDGNTTKVSFVKCDLRDHDAFLAVCEKAKPDVIIHCAAERRPDQCADNPEAATELNVSVSEHVAKVAKAVGSWLLYISTDYVFDGTQSPYKANAPTNPLNLYGKTKLQGEVAVRAIKSDAGVLRVPVLYGEVERASESSVSALLDTVLRSATSGDTVAVDDWATRYPTLTADVAVVLRGLCERKQKFCGFFGTWHFSGTEAFTKLELAQMIAEFAGIDNAKLVGSGAPAADAAPRPRNVKLDSQAISLMGLAKHTPVRKALPPIIKQLMAQHQQEKEDSNKTQ